jgi:hypothetical protein
VISYEIVAAATTTAPPERIFAVLDDFGRWPDWMPAFEHLKVELPRDATLGPGYSFRIRSGLVHTEMRVIDYSPLARATAFRVSFPPLTGTNRCRVVPLGDGQYLIDASQRERFARLADEFLQALKRTVEAQ